MNTEANADTEEQSPDRWMLIRDVAVLQVKLVFDGMRDLVLVPVSIIMAIVSLVKGGERPGPQFYDLMHLGKESEHWINLFGAAEHASKSGAVADHFAGRDIDAMVSQVEAFVVDEYKKGGVTAQAKDHFDKMLDSARRKANKSGNS